MTRRDLAAVPVAFWLRRVDAAVTPDIVRFETGIEPLVALIEKTPRGRCPEMAAEQLRRGVSYRQFMAALFLAGIRNVNPRPPGFALHCVFVIHSAHQLSLEAPPDIRLLPMFYALDLFKASQDRDAAAKSGDWTMTALRGPLPDPARARTELEAAMEAWDPERAERAVAAMVRGGDAPAAMEAMWEYGARDYRNIGHKAIFPASAHRTLQMIGWRHAEPVLRSVVLGLLDFGKELKVNGYTLMDQCYGSNRRRLTHVPPKLHQPAVDAETRAALGVLREWPLTEACAELASRLSQGRLSGESAWDAAHLAAAELALRAKAGGVIGGIHAVSAVNALRYAFTAAQDSRVRPLLLLQALGWMVQFRTFIESNPENVRAFDVTAEAPPRDGAYFQDAMRMAFTRAGEVHYYKYLAAIMEDSALVSLRWQPNIAGALEAYRKFPSDSETPAAKAAAEALKLLAG